MKIEYFQMIRKRDFSEILESFLTAGHIATIILCDNLNSFLQSNQVKRTPQESINEFIIQKLNPLLVVDFRLISAFLYV